MLVEKGVWHGGLWSYPGQTFQHSDHLFTGYPEGNQYASYWRTANCKRSSQEV